MAGLTQKGLINICMMYVADMGGPSGIQQIFSVGALGLFKVSAVVEEL